MGITTDNCYKEMVNYCALGDSLTVGVGSSFFLKGFISQYLYLMRQTLKRPIVPVIFGKLGATTADILKSLEHPMVIEGIRNAEIMTITAGGNDLIDAAENFLRTEDTKEFFIALDHCNKNLTAIMNRIKAIKSECNNYFIRMTNLYNPLPDIPSSDKWVEAFNRSIEHHARPPMISVADIHDQFAGKEELLLASDHIHPNDAGYRIMAESLHRLGYGRVPGTTS